MRVWQREQRGRSIEVNNCWDEDTMLPCVGREHYRLSVTDDWRIAASLRAACRVAAMLRARAEARAIRRGRG
jgi:hypothetical protein